MFGHIFYAGDIIQVLGALSVLIFIMAIFVSLRVKFIYSKFSKFNTSRGISGAVVARNILDSYGLYNVKVDPIYGNLTDHYDPKSEVVRLSNNNYYGTSIAAIGVAAHEVGHAVQHAKSYIPVKIRSAVVPLTRFSSFFYVPIFFAGIIFSSPKLSYIGVFMFLIVTFFSLITLPVEFDASFRAIKIIDSQNILEKSEIVGVKKVLWAAAMTYVVSFVMSFVQLLRLFLIAGYRDDD